MSGVESELPDDIYERVCDLSETGNNLLEEGQIDEAIAIWQSALALLPEPRQKWEASMWLHASIGDAQQQGGRTQDALDSFKKAAASADGYANGFVQLGIGTNLFDLGRTEESTDPLLRAFMAEGEEIFEESNPKYLDHLRR